MMKKSIVRKSITKGSAHRLAPFLLAGAAAAAIAVAPVASAADDDPHLQCTYQGNGNSQCQSPGNAQLTAAPPDVQYGAQYPFLLGGPILIHHLGGHGMGGPR